MLKGYVSEIFVSFQGEGAHAGRRHLFIRLAGCNLRCRYCDTPDSLERVGQYFVYQKGRVIHAEANPTAVSDVGAHTARLLASEGPIDGVALTGGEPLLQADFVAQLLAQDALPHPRVLETNGMLPAQLAVVLPVFDVVSMDMKLPSNTGEPEFWHAQERFLRLAGSKVYVKILVDAGTASEEVERAAALVGAEVPEAPVFLQPITDPRGRVAVGQSALRSFYDLARRHVTDVRVLPQTHKMLGIR